MKNFTFICNNSTVSSSVTLTLTKDLDQFRVSCVSLTGGVTHYLYDRFFDDYEDAWNFYISQIDIFSL